MTYQEKIGGLELFIRLLDESPNGAAFSISCVLHGIGCMAEASYFRDVLMPFMFRRDVARNLIRYQLALRERLPRLEAFFRAFRA